MIIRFGLPFFFFPLSPLCFLFLYFFFFPTFFFHFASLCLLVHCFFFFSLFIFFFFFLSVHVFSGGGEGGWSFVFLEFLFYFWFIGNWVGLGLSSFGFLFFFVLFCTCVSCVCYSFSVAQDVRVIMQNWIFIILVAPSFVSFHFIRALLSLSPCRSCGPGRPVAFTQLPNVGQEGWNSSPTFTGPNSSFVCFFSVSFLFVNI